MTRFRVVGRLVLSGLIVAAAGGARVEAATAAAPPCVDRILILSAYPAEADAVLSHVDLDPDPAIVIDGHHFYRGTMSGRAVVTAMTGIGLVNATDTTETALSHLTCAESGTHLTSVLFSGVAGGAGRSRIGDVVVPSRWTLDDGKSWRSADPALLARSGVLASTDLGLSHTDHAGDPACTCTDTSAVPIVDIARTPAVWVGGDGYSSDSNNGKAAKCTPGGGDTLGCEPCRAPDHTPPDVTATAPAIADLVLGNLAGGSSGTTSSSGHVYDAVDEETAAVQVVADRAGVPFLGFRGISDGPGDPLNLPGFPFEFFVYKQLAADNVATTVAAFLALPDVPVLAPASPEGIAPLLASGPSSGQPDPDVPAAEHVAVSAPTDRTADPQPAPPAVAGAVTGAVTAPEPRPLRSGTGPQATELAAALLTVLSAASGVALWRRRRAVVRG